eukprot:g11620.t1
MQTVGQIMQGHDQEQQQLQSSQLDVRGFSGHLKALNGLYNANGENHGKAKWIKHNSVDKTQQSCVYFWDERDGADMSGWWVAPQVGGEQVWAHANLQAVQQAMAMGGDGLGPPKTGWKAPWHSQAPDPAVVMEIRLGGGVGGMAGGAAAGGMNAAGAGGADGAGPSGQLSLEQMQQQMASLQQQMAGGNPPGQGQEMMQNMMQMMQQNMMQQNMMGGQGQPPAAPGAPLAPGPQQGVAQQQPRAFQAVAGPVNQKGGGKNKAGGGNRGFQSVAGPANPQNPYDLYGQGQQQQPMMNQKGKAKGMNKGNSNRGTGWGMDPPGQMNMGGKNQKGGKKGKGNKFGGNQQNNFQHGNMGNPNFQPMGQSGMQGGGPAGGAGGMNMNMAMGQMGGNNPMQGGPGAGGGPQSLFSSDSLKRAGAGDDERITKQQRQDVPRGGLTHRDAEDFRRLVGDVERIEGDVASLRQKLEDDYSKKKTAEWRREFERQLNRSKQDVKHALRRTERERNLAQEGGQELKDRSTQAEADLLEIEQSEEAARMLEATKLVADLEAGEGQALLERVSECIEKLTSEITNAVGTDEEARAGPLDESSASFLLESEESLLAKFTNCGGLVRELKEWVAEVELAGKLVEGFGGSERLAELRSAVGNEDRAQFALRNRVALKINRAKVFMKKQEEEQARQKERERLSVITDEAVTLGLVCERELKALMETAAAKLKQDQGGPVSKAAAPVSKAAGPPPATEGTKDANNPAAKAAAGAAATTSTAAPSATTTKAPTAKELLPADFVFKAGETEALERQSLRYLRRLEQLQHGDVPQWVKQNLAKSGEKCRRVYSTVSVFEKRRLDKEQLGQLLGHAHISEKIRDYVARHIELSPEEDLVEEIAEQEDNDAGKDGAGESLEDPLKEADTDVKSSKEAAGEGSVDGVSKQEDAEADVKMTDAQEGAVDDPQNGPDSTAGGDIKEKEQSAEAGEGAEDGVDNMPKTTVDELPLDGVEMPDDSQDEPRRMTAGEMMRQKLGLKTKAVNPLKMFSKAGSTVPPTTSSASAGLSSLADTNSPSRPLTAFDKEQLRERKREVLKIEKLFDTEKIGLMSFEQLRKWLLEKCHCDDGKIKQALPSMFVRATKNDNNEQESVFLSKSQFTLCIARCFMVATRAGSFDVPKPGLLGRYALEDLLEVRGLLDDEVDEEALKTGVIPPSAAGSSEGGNAPIAPAQLGLVSAAATVVDGTLLLRPGQFMPYEPVLRVVYDTILTEHLGIKSPHGKPTKPLKRMKLQEKVLALDLPTVDPASGLLRVKVRTIVAPGGAAAGSQGLLTTGSSATSSSAADSAEVKKEIGPTLTAETKVVDHRESVTHEGWVTVRDHTRSYLRIMTLLNRGGGSMKTSSDDANQDKEIQMKDLNHHLVAAEKELREKTKTRMEQARDHLPQAEVALETLMLVRDKVKPYLELMQTWKKHGTTRPDDPADQPGAAAEDDSKAAAEGPTKKDGEEGEDVEMQKEEDGKEDGEKKTASENTSEKAAAEGDAKAETEDGEQKKAELLAAGEDGKKEAPADGDVTMTDAEAATAAAKKAEVAEDKAAAEEVANDASSVDHASHPLTRTLPHGPLPTAEELTEALDACDGVLQTLQQQANFVRSEMTTHSADFRETLLPKELDKYLDTKSLLDLEPVSQKELLGLKLTTLQKIRVFFDIEMRRELMQLQEETRQLQAEQKKIAEPLVTIRNMMMEKTETEEREVVCSQVEADRDSKKEGFEEHDQRLELCTKELEGFPEMTLSLAWAKIEEYRAIANDLQQHSAAVEGWVSESLARLSSFKYIRADKRSAELQIALTALLTRAKGGLQMGKVANSRAKEAEKMLVDRQRDGIVKHFSILTLEGVTSELEDLFENAKREALEAGMAKGEADEGKLLKDFEDKEEAGTSSKAGEVVAVGGENEKSKDPPAAEGGSTTSKAEDVEGAAADDNPPADAEMPDAANTETKNNPFAAPNENDPDDVDGAAPPTITKAKRPFPKEDRRCFPLGIICKYCDSKAINFVPDLLKALIATVSGNKGEKVRFSDFKDYIAMSHYRCIATTPLTVMTRPDAKANKKAPL